MSDTFANIIHRRRAELDLTHGQLGNASGLSRRTIARACTSDTMRCDTFRRLLPVLALRVLVIPRDCGVLQLAPRTDAAPDIVLLRSPAWVEARRERDGVPL